MNTDITINRMLAMTYHKVADGHLSVRIMHRGWGLDDDRKPTQVIMVSDVTVYGNPTVNGFGPEGTGYLHGSDEDVAVLQAYVAPQPVGNISSGGGEVAFEVKDQPGGECYGPYTVVRMTDAATGLTLLRALT